MDLRRIACIAAVLLAVAGAARADDLMVPCKNHYILVDTCDPPPPATEKGAGTFRFANVYSSPSGGYQMLQMVEVAGANGQHRFAGRELVVRDRHGGVKRMTLTHDLWSERTAWQAVLFATDGSDFPIPPNFLPTDGGTLELSGVDAWELPPLPADGIGIIARYWPQVSVSMLPYLFTGFNWMDYARLGLTRTERFVEFRHESSDRYVVTMLAAEIEALDRGRIPGWTRTGESFEAWITRYDTGYEGDYYGVALPEGLHPVCRLYLPPPAGPEHFFSASEDECAAALALIPGMILETPQAFLATLPDPVSGICSQNANPLYRVWHRDAAGVSHRFTASKATRDAMVAKGWAPEGYGSEGVAMCTLGEYQDR
jgi:hypothetical protein